MKDKKQVRGKKVIAQIESELEELISEEGGEIGGWTLSKREEGWKLAVGLIIQISAGKDARRTKRHEE